MVLWVTSPISLFPFWERPLFPDINEALRAKELRHYKQEEIRRLVITIYLLLGIVALVIGIFYDKFKEIISANSIRSLYTLVGSGMIFIGFLLLQFVKKRESFLRRKTEYDILNGQIEKLKEEIAKAEAKLSYMEKSSDAETARLHTRIAYNEGSWETAALWWSRALIAYAKSEEEDLMNVSVNGLNRSLKKCSMLDDETREEIRASISYIPESPFLDRENIKTTLNTLPPSNKK